MDSLFLDTNREALPKLLKNERDKRDFEENNRDKVDYDGLRKSHGNKVGVQLNKAEAPISNKTMKVGEFAQFNINNDDINNMKHHSTFKSTMPKK